MVFKGTLTNALVIVCPSSIAEPKVMESPLKVFPSVMVYTKLSVLLIIKILLKIV